MLKNTAENDFMTIIGDNRREMCGVAEGRVKWASVSCFVEEQTPRPPVVILQLTCLVLLVLKLLTPTLLTPTLLISN